MSRTFEVEIFAMAVGAVGDCDVGLVQHNLEITSETSILYLPVKANILPRYVNNDTIVTLSKEYVF